MQQQIKYVNSTNDHGRHTLKMTDFDMEFIGIRWKHGTDFRVPFEYIVWVMATSMFSPRAV